MESLSLSPPPLQSVVLFHTNQADHAMWQMCVILPISSMYTEYTDVKYHHQYINISMRLHAVQNTHNTLIIIIWCPQIYSSTVLTLIHSCSFIQPIFPHCTHTAVNADHNSFKNKFIKKYQQACSSYESWLYGNRAQLHYKTNQEITQLFCSLIIAFLIMPLQLQGCAMSNEMGW